MLIPSTLGQNSLTFITTTINVKALIGVNSEIQETKNKMTNLHITLNISLIIIKTTFDNVSEFSN